MKEERIMEMAQTTVTFKTDKETKEIAQAICKQLGISLTSAINMFLHQMIMHDGIPFEVTLKPNAETMKAIEDAEKGIGMHGPFNSIEELLEDIEKDEDDDA